MVNLATARKKSGLTGREAAEKLGVSPQALSNYENGTRPIRFDTICEAAELYGCSTDYLAGRINEKQEHAVQTFLSAVDKMTPTLMLKAAGYSLPLSIQAEIETFLSLSESDQALIGSLIDRLAA